jgi:hypothetical protein
MSKVALFPLALGVLAAPVQAAFSPIKMRVASPLQTGMITSILGADFAKGDGGASPTELDIAKVDF